MAKSRYSRFPSRKSSSSYTIIFALFIAFTFLILILLVFGILSIPSSNQNLPKPNDLTSIAHNTVDRVRTSSGTFLARGRDKIVRNIEKRIADFTFIPVEHGEGLQVLHYEVGQKYEPHYDYFLDDFNTKNGGLSEFITPTMCNLKVSAQLTLRTMELQVSKEMFTA
ncbi:hypothetical protein TSUD_234830 [Trifolium subterraneum]|uniref:Prolyl 4-hydroxylase alpha subunit domain-containing protein n=1 Tax=Trifolium subterraneum TaxID=3900 RepID=A0A2Z6LTM8_TRISU|nr:hypothetical protein TSUD_234830 [Trifolium subterraneum]